MSRWDTGVYLLESAFSKRPRRPRHRGQVISRRPPRSRFSPFGGELASLFEEKPWHAPSDGEEGIKEPSRRAASAPPYLGVSAVQVQHAGQTRPFIGSVTWPSLREGSCGWDFCSEVSEITSWMGEELSETTTSSWLELLAPSACNPVDAKAGCYATLETTAPLAIKLDGDGWQPAGRKGRKSFADLLRSSRDGNHQACGGGVSSQPVSVRPPPRGVARRPPSSPRSAPSTGAVGGIVLEHSSDEDLGHQDRDSRIHGWQKGHKSSHSVKNRTKVQYQVARRAEQSRKARGF